MSNIEAKEIKSIGFIGLGLIGGSLARALRERAKIGHIVAYGRRSEPLELAKRDGTIDAYSTTDLAIFADCELVFICVPVNLIGDYARRLDGIVKEECILTDVGSTKATIVEELAGVRRFIGGHPMAGSERTGYESSSVDLCDGAYYVLTPTEDTPQLVLDTMRWVAEVVGATAIVMNAAEHDRAVAGISHLPHVLSSALVNLVRNQDEQTAANMRRIAAGGFRDTTRIAASDATLWSAVCIENKNEVLQALSDFRGVLEEFERRLGEDDEGYLRDFFCNAKNYRELIMREKNGQNDQS